MTQITAKVICDSVSLKGIRLTTVELVYPRFIHSELMTHRVFSRNAGSSRAIPVRKSLGWISRNPSEPIHWGANQPGMQAREELTGFKLFAVKALWKMHRRLSTSIARQMDRLGAHKQIVNRVTECHSHIRVLVTSTSWANFMALRNHPDAMPEICDLAQEIMRAIEYSRPTLLEQHEWHLPYITDDEINDPQLSMIDLVDISVARCARVSYRTHDDTKPDWQKDMELARKLVKMKPLHASPAEHQATPDIDMKRGDLWGNLYGWIQHRKTLPDEYVEDKLYNPDNAVSGEMRFASGKKPGKSRTLMTAKAKEMNSKHAGA